MAGLRLLKGKYYVRIWLKDPHGKTKEKLLPTDTSNKTDALRVLKRIEKEELEIKQKLRDELSYLNNRLTIEDGIKYFLKNVGKERGLRETTIRSYRLDCRDFLNAFKGKVCFENLTKEDYPVLIKYLSSRYNKTTTNIRLRSIQAMLNYLHEKEKNQRDTVQSKTG